MRLCTIILNQHGNKEVKADTAAQAGLPGSKLEPVLLTTNSPAHDVTYTRALKLGKFSENSIINQ